MLRRQKHALSQSTTPFACTLFYVFLSETQELSDPRNRNHKSQAIGNHNFEVASFSRRNHSKIAVSQSQKSHWAKKIAAIQNHTLVVATYSGGFPRPMWRFCNTIKTTQTGGSRVQRVGLKGCFRSRSDFLSCDCSRQRFVISKSLRFGSLSSGTSAWDSPSPQRVDRDGKNWRAPIFCICVSASVILRVGRCILFLLPRQSALGCPPCGTASADARCEVRIFQTSS